MRATLDLGRAVAGRLPVTTADGAELCALWTWAARWTCRGTGVELRVIATEAIDLPSNEASEPPLGAVARLLAACAPVGGLVMLGNPAEALGPRLPAAAGVRLVGVGSDADLAAWDGVLSAGQPMYGVRGRLRLEVTRAKASAVLAALAYGFFFCDDGLDLDHLDEDRQGVRWRVAAATADADRVRTAVIVRGGYEAARLRGPAGTWTDRGNEGYVRLDLIAPDGGRCLTQPRLIAPRPQLPTPEPSGDAPA